MQKIVSKIGHLPASDQDTLIIYSDLGNTIIIYNY